MIDTFDARTLRDAFGTFPSGVVAVCGMVEAQPVGMAASSFVSVSIDPPLIAFCVQWTSSTWPRLAALSRIGVSILGEAHDKAVMRLAAKTGDRFDGLDLMTTPDGAVFIEGSAAWLDCSVDQVVSAGDHGIVLLRVHALRMAPEVSPLVFHGSAFKQLSRA